MFWGPGSAVRDHQQLEKVYDCSNYAVFGCSLLHFWAWVGCWTSHDAEKFSQISSYGWHVKGLWLARFKTLFLQQHFTDSSQISGIQPATLKSNFSATQPDSRICCPSTFQGTAWGWLEIVGPRWTGFFLEPKPSLIIQYPTLRHTRISFALSMEISINSQNYPDLDHFCCSTLFKHPVMMLFWPSFLNPGEMASRRQRQCKKVRMYAATMVKTPGNIRCIHKYMVISKHGVHPYYPKLEYIRIC